MKRTAMVAVSGFSSEVGKTMLMCDLLTCFSRMGGHQGDARTLPLGGRDPETCCVSDLLGDEPVIRSGREQNYAVGKDTGRYWEAL
jgi:hypothetical protein